MHRDMFEAFERICRERRAGGDVLEIGAVPSEESLLCLDALAGATRKVGINLKPASTFRDFQIIEGNANDMACFEDDSFDTVLTNSVLEHDPFFWRTLEEMRRLARPGALIVIGVPGFTKLRGERMLSRIGRWPVVGRLLGVLPASTLILQIHTYPTDYYRFSPQAVEEVFLKGLEEKEVLTLMTLPRVIGVGRLP